MQSITRSHGRDVTRASEDYIVRQPPDSSEGVEDFDDENHSSLLPYQNRTATNPENGGLKWSNLLTRLLNSRRTRTLLLGQIVFGTFLASCPIPRLYLNHAFRVIFISIMAALVTCPSPRRAGHSKERLTQELFNAFGFCLSMYAIFGAADEVHIDWQWHSLLACRTYDGYQPGYLSRVMFIYIGLRLQRYAGLHSQSRILGAYLLSLVWVYADFPTTIFDHARGRVNW
ncbi:hypothetical protein BKA67DRAFT_656306 [Truncatella angustata]|uniref:Uncharacterized protein n=1 Tax=Truncatella angustata TaxID=152316 RepID=A0A9P8UTI9_9PEZI|nr:uncharacterized protein BKA67DRAFT_656306 [Truncatella angustata]KAH6658078.1 hypothetical protein BKA67DRAFT_656306 [Truncatella angustata]